MGWPTIMSRLMFGPVMKDRARIRNPETDLGASLVNSMLWQLAGMNGCVPRAMAICTISGTTISVVRRWLSWDPDATLPSNTLQFGYTSTGQYTWSFLNATYPDENGNAVALAFDAVDAAPVQADRAMVGDIGVSLRAGNLYARAESSGSSADVTRFIARWY